MTAANLPAQPSRPSHPSRLPLGQADWIAAATEVLAREGVSGLRVEVLAKRCGVTKGSFYWHFKDRQALLAAVLQHWKQGRIRDIEKTTFFKPGEELERINHLIELYGANPNRKGMEIELAIRDWARYDDKAAAVVEAVDLHRLECARKLFVAAGMSETEAKSRSLLLYACAFGLSLMRYAPFDSNLPQLKQRLSERIVAV
ncbi:MAG: TetR/AcrR family transcriptional regulator [Azonexus sp.]|nr:TetR/AcrR family transcriptional regulator [Azonexus sp.]